METNANVPSALRHLLARGTQQQQQIQQQQQHYQQGYNHNHSHNHTLNYNSGIDNGNSIMHNTYANQSAISSAATLQSPSPTQKLSSAKSTGNLKSGSSLGAWLSKYHLRPGGGARVPAKVSHGSTSSIGSSSQEYPAAAAVITSDENSQSSHNSMAFSAFITSVETREANGNGGPGELRMGGLRMGRKRFLVYRIQVTGNKGQWWVARRYSEFHELFQTLRRLFPQQSHQWNDLFPSKRLIPGLSSSADSVLHRREKLNSFLRALTQDASVCQCSTMQQFLHDDPIDAESVPLAERMAADNESEKHKYNGIQPLFHSGQAQQQQASKRSISSGNVLPNIDHTALYAQWQVPLPDKWQTIAPKVAPKGRESLERMASMPSLKSGSASRPQFDYSIPMPTVPQTAIHGYASLGHATGRSAKQQQQQQNPPAAEPIHMHRKISDPLEYASAEKRPNNTMPHSMRKKYGLRRNLQYRGDRIDMEGFPAPNSAGDQISHSAGRPPDTAATLMPVDSDYVMVDDESHGNNNNNGNNNMDIDRTLRSGSIDSDHDESIGRCDALGNKRGRTLAAPRRTPLGGIGKNRRLPNDDIAIVSAKSQMRSGKKQHSATTTAAPSVFKRKPGSDDGNDGDANDRNDESRADIDADGTGRSPHMNGPQKVSLDDFQLLSIIGKGSYGKVMLARYKDTGKVMAIKVISKSKLRGRPNEIRRVMSERKVLERTVRHPFLVGLQCAFQTKEKLFFCLDYVNGGELFFHLQRERRFGENRARFYAAEIASALAYLHSMDVVYRDLKPENCLLDAR
ncbi:hypothetical protein LPJ64_005705, partial [Coemansia asiatica]